MDEFEVYQPKLDLVSEPSSEQATPNSQPEQQARAGSSKSSKRPFFGIKLNCCGAYRRVYVDDPDREIHVTHCPRCGKRLRFRLSPYGPDATLIEYLPDR